MVEDLWCRSEDFNYVVGVIRHSLIRYLIHINEHEHNLVFV